MDRMHDPRVLRLPHPIRVDTAAQQHAEVDMFKSAGVWDALRPYLNDPTKSSEWLINCAEGMKAVVLRYLELAGDDNMGSFMLMLIRSRLRAQGDPILQVTPALQSLLEKTDVNKGLPVGFFRSPFTNVYIEFARPNAYRVSNWMSGLHELEGAYVGSYDLAPHHCIHQDIRAQRLRLDPNKPTRAIEVVFTGSPEGKQHALDDASHDLMMFVQDEDENLAEVLDRHIAFFRSPEAREHSIGITPIPEAEAERMTAIIHQLSKVLLYVNLSEAQQIKVNERSDLERKLRKLGKLNATRRDRLAVTYDRIVVGPTEMPENARPRAATGTRKKPHWRCGHFRKLRYGQGLQQSRLVWIQPVLVNADDLLSDVQPKEYSLH